ncbi:hypothetical protein XA68_16202 [Ophiocordyceps unilateralis]|uniref:alpha-1,2-Mannosidase n=1 Tax=Ophiocordyceps unilateralis TaxID=268505 RepID=A0A2A9P575_OPHUN|nr:hypothetical protein XA68_16202 [Ophiocordyceps unilateralis]
MMPSLRRRRDVVVALILAATLWYMWTVGWSGKSASSEWTRLQGWMNEPLMTSAVVGQPSSFDWGAVRLKYRPPPPKTLRMPRPGRANPPIQHPFTPESAAEARTRRARLGEVRRLFQANWDSYRRFAWGRDALLPVSGGGRDQFGGWAATLVDSLDTLWIMGLRQDFHEAAAAVAKLDFGQATTNRINVFETTIRYLGGLLAAYDLSQHAALLAKAVELGDLLYGAFNTVNGMPVDFLDLTAARKGSGVETEARVVAASPGTLSLELTRLSQLTGDAKYYDAAAAVMAVFRDGQNKTRVPGAWPMYVSMRHRDVVEGSAFTLGGSVDSLYEYLPKMHQLLRAGGEAGYDDMFVSFAEAARRHFLFRPMLPDGDDILLAGNINVGPGDNGEAKLDPETEHLACFLGATFALAGRLLKRPRDIETGVRLTQGCVLAYRAFPTGIMPERFGTTPCPDDERCEWKEDVWKAARDARPEWKPHLPLGFTHAKDPRYLLRPEAIESVFYLYRITGRIEFREAAWDMFVAVSNGTRTEFANAAVLDVTRAYYPLPKEDYMEYFYLVFSSPDVISLDDFVLNTEAHPFRVPRE